MRDIVRAADANYDTGFSGPCRNSDFLLDKALLKDIWVYCKLQLLRVKIFQNLRDETTPEISVL